MKLSKGEEAPKSGRTATPNDPACFRTSDTTYNASNAWNENMKIHIPRSSGPCTYECTNCAGTKTGLVLSCGKNVQ